MSATCPICQGDMPHDRVVCRPRCGDTALRLAAEVRAERTTTAPPRPVVVIGPPDGRLRLSDDPAPTPEAGMAAWLRVPPEHPGAEPPQRTDRTWRRAVARAGGGYGAEVHVGLVLGRRRPGAAWWDR